MSRIIYKLNIFFTKVFFKLKPIINIIKKILNNKIAYYLILASFIILLGLYIWSINNPHLFYRNFHGKYRIFHIHNLSNKILYGLYFTISFGVIQLLKYFPKYNNFLKHILKKYFNKLLFVYIVYIGIIFLLSFIDFKTKILSIISPIIVYFVYNIYNYIQETKENYKKWFLIDSRYIFLGALVLLIYTPIFIYFNDKSIAEKFSIYAYYFLVIGVVNEIFILFLQRKKTSKKFY